MKPLTQRGEFRDPRPPRHRGGERPGFVLAFGACLVLARGAAGAPEAAPDRPGLDCERLEIAPGRVVLRGPRDRARVLLTGVLATGREADLTRKATWSSDDPDVARVDGGVVRPWGEGRTVVRARAGGQEAYVPVEVASWGAPRPVSFRREVVAVLARRGCSSGPCHGSPSGKGGFHLSLRGHDPDFDARVLVREAGHRRTDRIDPDASLILAKPTQQVAHGGGQRLELGGPGYRLLRRWIAEGCDVEPAGRAPCESIEVLPGRRVLWRPHWRQQLAVRARFADGTTRDVSHLAVYSTSDGETASVGDEGLVEGRRRGEVAVTVRYLGRFANATLTFTGEVEGFAWTSPPVANPVDRLVNEKLRLLRYIPAPRASDAAFVRRVHLDLTGMLPGRETVERFLADSRDDRRERLVDRLLESRAHARFEALRWGDRLRLSEKHLPRAGVHKLWRWLVRSFAGNRPYDGFARAIVTARGSTFRNPPAAWYQTAKSPQDAAEATAQVFLGIRIQCANCHNHPFERWTQEDYHGLASVFARVREKPGPREGEVVVWVDREGEVEHPATGEPVDPWLPLAGAADVPGGADRREVFADWLVEPGNPFFARVEANRIWAHLLGRGIVDPVDDFRDSNPPSNGPLLDWLAAELEQSGYDRRHLIRTIVLSETYQRSAATLPANEAEGRWFSRRYPRLLSAEQLLDAVGHLTGVREKLPGLPPGTPATALPSPDASVEFLEVFGQPERLTVCACERPEEPSLSQALRLFNGPLVHRKLSDADNRFRQALAAGATDREVVEDLWIAAYARRPGEDELAAALRWVESRDDRREAFEDLCWALLVSKEFLFQH